MLIACTPPSGALFPVGTTAVLCTAVDNRQRTNACTFNVVVRPPAVTLGLTRFLAFGDSITWGEDGDPLVSCGSNNNLTTDTLGRIRPRTQVPQDFRYPTVLQRDLATRCTSQAGLLSVDNQGSPGEPASASFPTPTRLRSLLNGGLYQAVLIMEGTNDIFYGDHSRSIRRSSGSSR